jgi:hypothetical protein
MPGKLFCHDLPPRTIQVQDRSKGNSTETNRIQIVMFDMQNKTLILYFAAKHRILIAVMHGIRAPRCLS